jgi:hypothetical protein
MDVFVAKLPPYHVLLRSGNVNTGAGDQVDVLFVNGSAGEDCHRKVVVPAGATVTIDVIAPPGGPNPAHFTLYAWPGEARAQNVTEQPLELGTACFPTPLSNGNPTPPPITLVNTMGAGYYNLLGIPMFSPVPPAPTTIGPFSAPAGIYTLQGFIQDNSAGGGTKQASITNAIVVEVQ